MKFALKWPKKKTIVYVLGTLILLLVLVAPILFIEQSADALKGYIAENYLIASIIYIAAVIASVILAPFNLPLFYIAGGIWGPYIAAVYNIFGWCIGAAIAFLLARRFGKPFISKFIPMNKIEEYEDKINPNIAFWGVVLLRVLSPVDILSYALGLFSKISFKRYILATFIGITPFGIMFGYGGSAFVEGKFLIFGVISALTIIAIIAGAIIIKNTTVKK